MSYRQFSFKKYGQRFGSRKWRDIRARLTGCSSTSRDGKYWKPNTICWERRSEAALKLELLVTRYAGNNGMNYARVIV